MRAAEKKVLDGVLPDLFGYYLLQLGECSTPDLVGASRIRNRVRLVGSAAAQPVADPVVRASPQALPIATDSIDVAVLSHVLELEESPHDALRELERVLVPEGHVVVVGFNPISLFGVWRLLARRASGPAGVRLVGVAELKDRLALLGFDVVSVRTSFFSPPFGNPGLLERMRWLERVGARWWSYAGAVYVVVARKRVATLTPIKPRWRPARNLVGLGLAEPTTRSSEAIGRAARRRHGPGSVRAVV